MGRVAADYAAEDYHGVVHAGFDELRGGKGEFDGSGHVVEVDGVAVYSGRVQGVYGSVAQGGRDVAVPLGGDYGHALVFYCGQLAGGCGM